MEFEDTEIGSDDDKALNAETQYMIYEDQSQNIYKFTECYAWRLFQAVKDRINNGTKQHTAAIEVVTIYGITADK
ncbi:hypothetical protein HK100_002012, partial [Physocladia obscura]